MPVTVPIISFTPEEAEVGEAITVKTEGVFDKQGASAYVVTASWYSIDRGGESAQYISPSAVIVDVETFTEFTAMLSPDTEHGTYALQMIVSIDGESYKFDSDSIKVTVDAGGRDVPRIDSVIPFRVSIDRLQTYNFTLTGTALDEVGQWFIQSSPSTVRLTHARTADPHQVRLKPQAIPSGIQPGKYKVKGLIEGGGVIYSRFPIRFDV